MPSHTALMIALLFAGTSFAQTEVARAVEEPSALSEPSRFRFAPSLSLLAVGVSPSCCGGSAGLGSLRPGLRWAMLERSRSSFSTNIALTIEVGVESQRSPTVGPLFGLALTARVGPAFVTKNGLFFPFAEIYALATVMVIPLGQASFVTGRLGLGTSFNAFGIRSADSGGSVENGLNTSSAGGNGYLILLAALVPKIEVVWGPPTALDPKAQTVEFRFGVGF